jgi:hypothetical protein
MILDPGGVDTYACGEAARSTEWGLSGWPFLR